jgi:Fe-S-cluster containining protein
MMLQSLPVVNLNEATFECTFGRGCEGICCRNGRPPVPADEAELIQSVLPRALKLMTPVARELVEEAGFLSRRMKEGAPMLRVADGWCVFFNKGCVLHTIGAEDGDAYKYKPAICALFPLEPDKGKWHIRQWGHNREDWDLFCLNPANSTTPAATSLQNELALAAQLEHEKNSQRAVS